MKGLILATACLASFSGHAFAQETKSLDQKATWYFVAQGSAGAMYFIRTGDQPPIKEPDGKISVWLMIDFTHDKANTLHREMTKWLVDCNAGAYAVIADVGYHYDNKVAFDESTPNAAAHPVVPNTVGEKIAREVCGDTLRM